MFWPLSGSEEPPRVPESLKWFQIDDLVCPQNSGLNLLLWDDFTMRKPGVTLKEGGKGISDDLRHVLDMFNF